MSEPFTYRLKRLEQDGVTVKGAEIDVQAYLTATPGVIVTQAVKPRSAGEEDWKVYANRWKVTHAESGFSVDDFKRGTSLKAARLIAGALGGLPLDWTAKTKGEMLAQWSLEVPLEFKRWVARLKEEPNGNS